MIVIKFRSSDEAGHTLLKLKKMKKFVNELIDCMEEEEKYDYHERRESHGYEDDDDVEYREDPMRHERVRHDGRYAYRRGRM